MDDQMQTWVKEHLKDNVARLLLKYHSEPWAEQAITQIECRQKSAGKIKELLKCDAFMFPHRLSAEQCTSQIVADFHRDLAHGSETWLDMTSGLGVDVLTQAQKRRSIIAIDINSSVVQALSHNATALGLTNITPICADSVEWLKEHSGCCFDVIFIDPARRDTTGGRLKALKDCEPDVTAILPLLLERASRILIKSSPMLDIQHTIAELNSAAIGRGSVSHIYSVGTPTECKEILAIIDRTIYTHPEILAVTLTGNGKHLTYSVDRTDQKAPVLPSIPIEGMWLYEPYPATMKVANSLYLGNSICRLDKDTHLYVSDQYETGLPCKPMKIIRVLPYNDKNARQMGREFPIANVATRNFALSAPELAKRLKIKDGGKIKIFGAKANGRNVLIAAQSVD